MAQSATPDGTEAHEEVTGLSTTYVATSDLLENNGVEDEGMEDGDDAIEAPKANPVSLYKLTGIYMIFTSFPTRSPLDLSSTAQSRNGCHIARHFLTKCFAMMSMRAVRPFSVKAVETQGIICVTTALITTTTVKIA